MFGYPRRPKVYQIFAFFIVCRATSLSWGAFTPIVIFHDGVYPSYFGNSNPTGSAQVNIFGSNPGYLNQMTGGIAGGATGTVGIFDPYENDTELVALAIQVADNAGDEHSLSGLDDPALENIVSDINTSNPNIGLTAYAYDAAPQIYARQIASLTAGETANLGQPFDILLVENYNIIFPHSFLDWGFDFSAEIGNSDGIVALSLTDVGAIPEPTGLPLIFLGLAGLLNWRGRRTASPIARAHQTRLACEFQ